MEGSVGTRQASPGTALSPCERAPIKIVRVIGRLNIGGPAIHAVLLTEGLNDLQFQSTLVTGVIGKSEGDMLHVADQRGVTPLIIPELGREISWRDDVVALWKLYCLLVRERPDIVHTHTAKAGTLGRVAAMLAGVPIRIHTFHGHVFHGYFGSLKTRFFIVIERLLARWTTRIIAISDTQKAELSSHYQIAPADKFAVVPIGLDLASLLQGEAGRSEGDSREIVIGFVGRLVPVKNPSMALEAFERLVRMIPVGKRIRLVVVGDGELRAALEAQVKRSGIEQCVQFIGWQRDVATLYRQFDLVVLTSFNEGTPVVLIEAMAAGLPFVATRVGGMPDLMPGSGSAVRLTAGCRPVMVFSNGILVESGDVEGCAVAMASLIRDPVRMKNMGREGRQFVWPRYSKDRLVDDMRELYLDCLRQRAGVRSGMDRGVFSAG